MTELTWEKRMLTPDLIIMAAPNGARRTRMDHPNLPIRPAEIAAELRRCAQSGAAMAHIHVRGEAGEHCLDASRYEEALAAIGDAVGDEIIVQITTEALGRYEPNEQMAVVRALRPEAVSLALGEICPADGDEDAAVDFFNWMKEERIWPQIILHDPGEATRMRSLIEDGRYPFAVPYLLFVLGGHDLGRVGDPLELDAFFAAIGETDGLRWGACAFGSAESACVRAAMSRGGDARVGFENNIMMPDGRRANHTADLVALTREAGLALGRRRFDAPALRAHIPDWIGR